MTTSLASHFNGQCMNIGPTFASSSAAHYTLEYPPKRHRSSMFSGLKKRLSKRLSNVPENSARGAESTMSTVSSGSESLRKSSVGAPSTVSTLSAPAPATRRPGPSNATHLTPPTDAPPAYTPTAPSMPMPSSSSSNPTNRPSNSTDATDADPYAFLRTFDTIFLIDDSGSMAGRSWSETASALQAITPICTARDADGIDIYFLNTPSSPFHRNVTQSSTVLEIFSTVRPWGATPTGQRLNAILRPYLARYEREPESTKPVNIIVITDGEPSDDVESVLVHAAKKLDRLEAPAWQVGVQFFQVGCEAGAREHLKMLDDGLAEAAGGEVRDIVDTVPWRGGEGEMLTGAGILKVVLGSVNRRLDRNSKDLHRRT